MNLQFLQALYQNDVRLKQLAAALSSPTPALPQGEEGVGQDGGAVSGGQIGSPPTLGTGDSGGAFRFYLDNLRGASVQFVAAAVWQLSDANHVFVLTDREEAAYFHNDLERLTGALDIQYFPDSFKKGFLDGELNSSHVMLRTEALTKATPPAPSGGGGDIAAVRKKVLVTFPEALFEKVVNPKALTQSMIRVKVGEVLKAEEVMKSLVALGFKREDFVYEPGQFAMRGGILDIYSFGNEHPYRIELFGNDVDSIRLFNPETQLSERRLAQISILPNIETKFESGERISLLDYLPDNTVFWFKDYDFTLRKMEQMRATLPERIEIGTADEDQEEEVQQVLHAHDFEVPDEWREKVQRRHLVEWFNHSILPPAPSKGGGVNPPPDVPLSFGAGRGEGVPLSFGKGRSEDGRTEVATLQFATEEQPAFNRQFDLLIKDLQKRAGASSPSSGGGRGEAFIFSDNPKQLERLRSIFEDLNAEINFTPIPIAISKGFIDHDRNIVCYTDHQIFQRYHKFKVKQAYSRGKAITLKALRELQPGDYVTHIDHGIGQYSGLQKIDVNGAIQEAVRILYKDGDVLYVNINSLHKISKYTGKEGAAPRIHKLGSDAWEKLKNKTKRQVKDIASDLIKLYAKRKAAPGFQHTPDTYLQTELEASFIYEDTPDQAKATTDVKKDMESPHPMDRLVCGDVGFGKTEIAVRAAFKTVVDGKQAAVLVPTTILAYQHFQTFKERLKDFPCTVDYINRFKTAKEKKETLQRLAEGKVDIIIGTHAVLAKDVQFKDLGLLVIDEEQKFGVAAKEKLRERKANVDTLTLTATPIPRTLQFSLMSARDLSIINTPPPNRQPVQTEVTVFDEYAIRDAIYFEVERGGQIYFVHNRVQSLADMAGKLKELCPDVQFAVAHGQMEGNKLEEVLQDFIAKKYDVLCCTNIVESGVDIANANTMIINNAHQFGLSDLHQLRGRVGRSNKKAFCYLIAPPFVTLPDDSRKRLQTLEQFNELGSGFQISMRDLDIRGAGDILGGEQSGFINDIGFEMYQKILAEAMHELKSTDFKDVFADELQQQQDYVTDCTIDTDQELLIPDGYVSNITERLSLYTQLDDLEREEDLAAFAEMLIDRFGPMPSSVQDLFIAIRCRRAARELGFEKLILKNTSMRLYFISNPDSPYFESEAFQKIMSYIQTRTNKAKLKQVGKNFMLVVEGMKSMKEVLAFLNSVSATVGALADGALRQG